MILILKFNLTSLRNIYINTFTLYIVFVEHHTHFYVYICFSTKSNSIRGRGSRYLYEFSFSNNYMSLLRATTCDALIVPSENYQLLPVGFPGLFVVVCTALSWIAKPPTVHVQKQEHWTHWFKFLLLKINKYICRIRL